MNKNQKLELNWVGKSELTNIEPRILLEDVSKGHFADSQNNVQGLNNSLIFGDNLLALKALEGSFSNEVKCIYIDPPYNTGSAFAQYEDGLEHSIWLSMIRIRLLHLKPLLREDGSIWIQLDDNESHYCKVMLDEIFGRENFVANLIWHKSYAVRSNAQFFSTSHEHILVYCKNRQMFNPNKFQRTYEQESRYANPDNDPRGQWQSVTMTISLVGGARGRQYAKTGKSENIFEVTSPSGKKHFPPPNRCWSRNPKGFDLLDRDGRIWWGPKGDGAPRMKLFLSEAEDGVLPTTLWADGETFGHNQQGIREIREINLPDFPTPKPERLIRKVLDVATNPGDLVLDSFAGSGTTGAVAHKMGRRWIMIELGEHCHTHIIPRMKKVIDGQDPGGITEAVGWKGGGGFRYYRLAPSLLEKDAWGNYVISKEYNPAMLSEAVCRHMGFTYAPSAEHYWMHGRSSEQDFIYVTTATLTAVQLRALSEEVGERRSLLICCKAFTGSSEAYPNLTLKKIPNAVLKKCEWGRDDYSLHITQTLEPEATEEEPEAEEPTETDAPKTAKRGRPRKASAGQQNLLDVGATP